jgi:uncharacterized membrane protein YhfC
MSLCVNVSNLTGFFVSFGIILAGFADRFLQYEELTAWLHQQVSSNNDIATIESYGKSHEGRDLWLVTITNKSTGLHSDKPAHWVDGMYRCL